MNALPVLVGLALLCSVLQCSLANNGDGDGGDRVEILIPKGPIIGEKYLGFNNHLITRFLGIPYAQPPVGKLRFRRPLPIEKWNQSILALEWPNNCYQKPHSPEKFLRQNFTEDCLYLNIWSTDVNRNEKNLKPVLVYIHGGGFKRGGSSDRIQDLERLAIMTDSITVSINYRLSGFGFFYSDRLDDIKGNQGLWDQTLALEWINENIRYFGGDSRSITLMGNSAGSWSVSLHILSPVSRNLFRNAIMMSGSANYRIVGQSDTIVAKLLQTLRTIGCAQEEDTAIDQKIVDCLETADEELVDKISSDPGPLVVVDGEFLPAPPNEMLKTGNHKKDFNLLVSTVEDEGSFLFARMHPDFKPNTQKPITLNQAQDILIETVMKTNQGRSFNKAAILRMYFSGFNRFYDDPDLFKKQVGIAYGDLILTCPTLNFAKDLFRSNSSSINVYQWLYKAKIGKIKDLCSKWAGTCHADELYPVFAVPFGEQHLYHNRERELSREITTFIKSFIRTGLPGPEQDEWIGYSMLNGQVIAPYYIISNQYKTHESYQFNLKQLECDNVWNEFY